MARSLKVVLLAGEESGVLYARRLQQELCRAAGCEVEFRGYDTEGFKTGDLAVMGFWPVLKRLGYFLGVAKTMKRVIATWRPDVVVTIDYPGLNLKLAAYAKNLGIPAVHVVCPQVWAWHQNRIPKIAAALTKLLCFFPFEPKLFAQTGLDAKFIGHPLVDVFASEGTVGADAAETARPEKVLALLPGSRLGEINRHLPRLVEALDILAAKTDVSNMEVRVPAANDKAAVEIRRILRTFGFSSDSSDPSVLRSAKFTLHLQQGRARELLRSATVAVVASGTATLEAALAQCPTVLVYAVSPLLAWFARRVITGVHYIGLANVIWEKSGGTGEAPMPELLQEAFTPEAVASRLVRWLTDDAARQTARQRLEEAMALLKSDGNALGLAAREILSTVPRTD
ncbi:MAG: lipid-A-disaccharide synthase [Kiritimatiellae bacterium]|nr:lipid-A-disaccharide synthase [Kiritimatiellia bacterium]